MHEPNVLYDSFQWVLLCSPIFQKQMDWCTLHPVSLARGKWWSLRESFWFPSWYSLSSALTDSHQRCFIYLLPILTWACFYGSVTLMFFFNLFKSFILLRIQICITQCIEWSYCFPRIYIACVLCFFHISVFYISCFLCCICILDVLVVDDDIYVCTNMDTNVAMVVQVIQGYQLPT